MTLGTEEKKLLRFVGETEMDDLGVVVILGPENLERQKESCEAEFVKELDLNASERDGASNRLRRVVINVIGAAKN